MCDISPFLTIFHELYAKQRELVTQNMVKREYWNSESL